MESREARPDDFPHLLRLTYPSALPGTLLREHVSQEWRWLWDTARFLAVVVESDRGSVVALMGATLITEEFFRRLVVAEHPFVNRRLSRAPLPGDNPLANDQGSVNGTATLLMNYFAWDAEGKTPEETAILRGILANAFLDIHGGYAIRRIAVEVVGSRMLDLTLRTGSSVVNDYALWSNSNNVAEEHRPYLAAIEKGQALQTENHWYSRAFGYRTPSLNLGVGQRQVLRLACQGLTDQQIAERLSVGHEAIKKRWESVYDRFHERLPGVLALSPGGRRGSEKRRVVVAYIQKRLEEIRP